MRASSFGAKGDTLSCRAQRSVEMARLIEVVRTYDFTCFADSKYLASSTIG